MAIFRITTSLSTETILKKDFAAVEQVNSSSPLGKDCSQHMSPTVAIGKKVFSADWRGSWRKYEWLFYGKSGPSGTPMVRFLMRVSVLIDSPFRFIVTSSERRWQAGDEKFVPEWLDVYYCYYRYSLLKFHTDRSKIGHLSTLITKARKRGWDSLDPILPTPGHEAHHQCHGCSYACCKPCLQWFCLTQGETHRKFHEISMELWNLKIRIAKFRRLALLHLIIRIPRKKRIMDFWGTPRACRHPTSSPHWSRCHHIRCTFVDIAQLPQQKYKSTANACLGEMKRAVSLNFGLFCSVKRTQISCISRKP